MVKMVGSKKRKILKRNLPGGGSFKNRTTLKRKIERIENNITYFKGGREVTNGI